MLRGKEARANGSAVSTFQCSDAEALFTYRDDYEYVAGLGDLDRCNGMTVSGQYGYYITDNFPYMMFCFSGTPHTSFNKLAAGASP